MKKTKIGHSPNMVAISIFKPLILGVCRKLEVYCLSDASYYIKKNVLALNTKKYVSQHFDKTSKFCPTRMGDYEYPAL